MRQYNEANAKAAKIWYEKLSPSLHRATTIDGLKRALDRYLPELEQINHPHHGAYGVYSQALMYAQHIDLNEPFLKQLEKMSAKQP